jgi:hypothetical protein
MSTISPRAALGMTNRKRHLLLITGAPGVGNSTGG